MICLMTLVCALHTVLFDGVGKKYFKIYRLVIKSHLIASIPFLEEYHPYTRISLMFKAVYTYYSCFFFNF